MDFSVIYDFFANNMHARGFTAKNIKDACAVITNAASTASGHGCDIDVDLDGESSNKRKPNPPNMDAKCLEGDATCRVDNRKTSPPIVLAAGKSSNEGQWMGCTRYDQETSSTTYHEGQRITSEVLDRDLQEAPEDTTNCDAQDGRSWPIRQVRQCENVHNVAEERPNGARIAIPGMLACGGRTLTMILPSPTLGSALPCGFPGGRTW